MPRARYLAPILHACIFTASWALASISSQPILEGPGRVGIGIVFLADMPISAFCFGAMFTSDDWFRPALVAWGVLGTVWWFFLGMSIEAWQKRLAARRA
jgi:hypothetical protein